MTDKEKIRAEIERLYNENKERHSIEGISACTQLHKVLSFIDSMPEEPVNEDLEEEWKRYITSEEYLNDIPGGLPVARHFAKWGKYQIMKTAVGAVVKYDNFGHLIVRVDDIGVKSGDEIKIRIFKED